MMNDELLMINDKWLMMNFELIFIIPKLLITNLREMKPEKISFKKS